MADTDELVDMARGALGALEGADLDALEAGLGKALEAARLFRVQIDLGGRVDLDRLLAFEELFRSAVGVQPRLTEVELDGTVAALEAEQAPAAEVVRAGNLRANAFVVARAVLDSLRAGYKVGFDVEARR